MGSFYLIAIFFASFVAIIGLCTKFSFAEGKLLENSRAVRHIKKVRTKKQKKTLLKKASTHETDLNNSYQNLLTYRLSSKRVIEGEGFKRLVIPVVGTNSALNPQDRKSMLIQYGSYCQSRKNTNEALSILLTSRLSSTILLQQDVRSISVAEYRKGLEPPNESLRIVSSRNNPLDDMLGLSHISETRDSLKASFVRENNDIDRISVLIKVCAKLEAEMLSIDELNEGNEVEENSFSLNLIKNTFDPKANTLKAYLGRLMTGLNHWFHEEDIGNEITGIRCILMSLIYLSRLKEVEKNFALTELNVYKLFAVMMLTAAKFSEDVPLSQTYWAEVSGIEIQELIVLERSFCMTCGFNFFITTEDLTALYEEYGLKVLVSKVRDSVRQERLSLAFSVNLRSLGIIETG